MELVFSNHYPSTVFNYKFTTITQHNLSLIQREGEAQRQSCWYSLLRALAKDVVFVSTNLKAMPNHYVRETIVDEFYSFNLEIVCDR